MENYEGDVERFLRLSLVAVASIALLGLIGVGFLTCTPGRHTPENSTCTSGFCG